MEAQRFAQWMDAFFDSYYRLRPVNGTFIGRHDFDHLLPDCSDEGVAQSGREAGDLLAQAARIDRSTLSPLELMDLDAAAGSLRIQRWEAESEHTWRGNPSLALGEAIFGVIGLLLTEYAPASARAAAAMDRMNAIPALLHGARSAIHSAPLAWAQKALTECAGGRALFARGIQRWASDCGVVDGLLEAAASSALAAVNDYALWLEDLLRSAARVTVAAGADALALHCSDGHFLEQSPDEIERYAEEALHEAHAELARRAGAMGASDKRSLLAALVQPHPSTKTYLRRFRELWESSRALAEERDLLTWPDIPIRYVAQPHWAREAALSLYFLFYRAPACYARPPVHEYLVTPIEGSMSQQEQMRLLQANNDSVIKLNHVVHHGGIGHHVQNWHAYRGPSRIGQVAAVDCASRIALFCGGTMAEGWACYATTLMHEAGFLSAQEELSEAHTRARMAARAIVDVRLHQGRMGLEQAAEFYQQNTAMSVVAAQAEATRNSMFPGAALMYLVGHDSILELRAQMQRQQGSAFRLREFHDSFLDWGSLPVALVARAMRAGHKAPLTEPAHALLKMENSNA